MCVGGQSIKMQSLTSFTSPDATLNLMEGKTLHLELLFPYAIRYGTLNSVG